MSQRWKRDGCTWYRTVDGITTTVDEIGASNQMHRLVEATGTKEVTKAARILMLLHDVAEFCECKSLGDPEYHLNWCMPCRARKLLKDLEE